jgi:hypothetical protein
MEVKQLKGLVEAYNQVYCNDDNFISDLSEVCLENFFETYEDSDYFAYQLIEQDLLEEFLLDFAEELDADISCYLGESFLQEKVAVLRSIVNALSAGGRAKAGLGAATALGKTGNVVKGTAASTAIRSARKAAKVTQPTTSQPGKYLTALQSKRAARGLPPAGGTTAGTTKAVTQRATTAGWQRDAAAKNAAKTALGQAATVARAFMKSMKHGAAQQKLSTAAKGTTGTGVRIGQPGATRAALPAQVRGGELATTTTQKITAPKGGSLATTKPSTLSKTPEIEPVKVKDITKGGGLTHTVRATLSPTEKAGGMKYPGLEKYATGSKSSGGPSATPKVSKAALAAGAATGAGAAAALGSAEKEKQKRDAETRANIKTDVYNTMDPSGKIRSRKKVGPAKIGDTFEDAFRFYRQRGDKTFDYAGKKYTTQLASEENEGLELFIDVLLDEGYVSDYNGALSMINSLDENALLRLAGNVLKNTIKTGGKQISKTKLPPKVDPAFQFVKQQMIKQHGASAVMGTSQQKYAAAAARQARQAKPSVKPQQKPDNRSWQQRYEDDYNRTYNPPGSGTFRKSAWD